MAAHIAAFIAISAMTAAGAGNAWVDVSATKVAGQGSVYNVVAVGETDFHIVTANADKDFKVEVSVSTSAPWELTSGTPFQMGFGGSGASSSSSSNSVSFSSYASNSNSDSDSSSESGSGGWSVKNTENEEETKSGAIILSNVKIELESVSSADFIGERENATKVYATAQDTNDGKAVIQLKQTPSGENIPEILVTWSGGTPGNDALQRLVSKEELIENGENVTATACGDVVFKGEVYVFRGAPTANSTEIDITITQDDSIVYEPVGRTERRNAFNPSVSCGIYYENASWRYVFEKVSYEILWGVNGFGRVDVSDASETPFPLGLGMAASSTEEERRIQASADLRPDENGIAPRSRYWSFILTVVHELFHVEDWVNVYYPPAVFAVEAYVEAEHDAVTLDTLVPSAMLHGMRMDLYIELMVETNKANGLYNEDAEDRAYGAGRLDYQNLSNDIINHSSTN